MTEVEFWAYIRQNASGSKGITIPAAMATVLEKSQNSPIVGKQVKVRVVM